MDSRTLYTTTLFKVIWYRDSGILRVSGPKPEDRARRESLALLLRAGGVPEDTAFHVYFGDLVALEKLEKDVAGTARTRLPTLDGSIDLRPVPLASQAGQVRVLEWLNAKDAISTLPVSPKREALPHPLHVAIRANQPEAVRWFLRNDAAWDAGEVRETLLRSDSTECVRVWLTERAKGDLEKERAEADKLLDHVIMSEDCRHYSIPVIVYLVELLPRPVFGTDQRARDRRTTLLENARYAAKWPPHVADGPGLRRVAAALGLPFDPLKDED